MQDELERAANFRKKIAKLTHSDFKERLEKWKAKAHRPSVFFVGNWSGSDGDLSDGVIENVCAKKGLKEFQTQRVLRAWRVMKDDVMADVTDITGDATVPLSSAG